MIRRRLIELCLGMHRTWSVPGNPGFGHYRYLNAELSYSDTLAHVRHQSELGIHQCQLTGTQSPVLNWHWCIPYRSRERPNPEFPETYRVQCIYDASMKVSLDPHAPLFGGNPRSSFAII